MQHLLCNLTAIKVFPQLHLHALNIVPLPVACLVSTNERANHRRMVVCALILALLQLWRSSRKLFPLSPLPILLLVSIAEGFHNCRQPLRTTMIQLLDLRYCLFRRKSWPNSIAFPLLLLFLELVVSLFMAQLLLWRIPSVLSRVLRRMRLRFVVSCTMQCRLVVRYSRVARKLVRWTFLVKWEFMKNGLEIGSYRKCINGEDVSSNNDRTNTTERNQEVANHIRLKLVSSY